MSKYLSQEAVHGLMYQIGGKDNWEAVYEVPSWLALYDRMPRRMQMAFSFKLQGYNIKEIAELMGISEKTSWKHLNLAKKRIINSLLNYS